MADRSILYRLRAALQGGKVAVAQEIELLSTFIGVITGVNNIEDALRRFDATGVGADLFSFTGAYSAQSSNITEWFGGKQLVRMRCTGRGGSSPGQLNFDLPGTTALNTAFDQLSTLGIEERITFIIEYTGDANSFISIRPRISPSPQIQGTTNILVRSGVAATIEVTRKSGTISDYVFLAIGLVGDVGGGVLGAIRPINPATAVWDASDNGPLPSQVEKGNAFKVVNAPSDGTGRFGEVMYNDDYIVWLGETFTSWSAEPHQWGVISFHDVRRISALEQDFLTEVEVTSVSDRNKIIRGANYADQAGEIRMKLYSTLAGYSAADLNTTGDIDEYQDASSQTAFLAIRLTGVLSAIEDILPTLYVYVEHDSVFTRLLNLQDDFTHEGDFVTESDYLSTTTINYAANDVLRIYVGQVLDRYNIPSLDIYQNNLSDNLQSLINNTHGSGNVDSERLRALESKMDALFPLTPDVTILDEWAGVIGPERTIQIVDITRGYSLIADFRDASTRYESSDVVYDDTGTNVIRYSGLSDNLYRAFGFKVTAPSDQILLWLVDGATLIPFVDMTSAGNFRINSYTTEVGEDEVVRNQFHFLTRSGTEVLAANDGNVSTYTITPFPSNASDTSRMIQIDPDIFVNGNDTQAARGYDINLPATNTAQDRQTLSASVFLGPLYNNRTVDIVIGYTLRVSGSDLIIDFELISAPSDVTIRLDSVAAILNYTAPGATTRVDNFVVLQDDNGDYTFTGENELLITFHPYSISNSMNVVPVVVGSTGDPDELNDLLTPIPGHSFESVEIPDTIDFRTFSPDHFLRHSDLSSLLENRNVQWCYGISRLLDVRDLSITGLVDFTGGLNIDGNQAVSVVTGTAAPTVTPDFVGQIFVDTTSKVIYIASGNGSSGDWVQV